MLLKNYSISETQDRDIISSPSGKLAETLSKENLETES
jgi:hypothetical protein